MFLVSAYVLESVFSMSTLMANLSTMGGRNEKYIRYLLQPTITQISLLKSYPLLIHFLQPAQCCYLSP